MKGTGNMQTRRFGRTEHESTVAIFGAAAFWEISQAEADRVMELVIQAGVNHIDVAPSYGQAEERIGPWMPRIRSRFFIGCKTTERTRQGAWEELHRSLKRLQCENFDLYQLHAVNSFEELDAVTAPGGALEALVQAHQAGLIRHIGITGHGINAPAIYLEALRRFDFDTVTFPLNFVQAADAKYYREARELMAQCQLKDVGSMVIKSIAIGPWGEKQKTHTTWYEPFADMDMIQRSVDFVLSHAVTGLCTAGDVRLLPLVLKACQAHAGMASAEMEKLVESGRAYQPLFT
jgi:aryl-alcohol dehydrogenase-like predicted oxidoreductase